MTLDDTIKRLRRGRRRLFCALLHSYRIEDAPGRWRCMACAQIWKTMN